MRILYRITLLLVLLMIQAFRVDASDVWLEGGPVFGVGKPCSFCEYFGSVGGKLVVNVNRYLAADADISHGSTSDHFFLSSSYEVYSNFNLKVTHRTPKFNVFGIGGLGFVNLPEYVPDNVSTSCASVASKCIHQVREFKKGFNFGGGFELLPERPVSVRVDMTDVKGNHNSGINDGRFRICFGLMLHPRKTSH